MPFGELDELVTSRERERRAGRVLEIGHHEDDPWTRPGPLDEPRGGRDVHSLVIDRDFDGQGTVIAQGSDRVGEERRLDEGDVAWLHEHPHREIDRLESSGRDDDVLGTAGDPAVRHLVRDDRA